MQKDICKGHNVNDVFGHQSYRAVQTVLSSKNPITSYKKTFNNSQFIDLVTAVKGIKLFSNSRKLYLRSTFLLYMTFSKLSPRVKA